MGMKVLVFSSLYPNHLFPHLGVFIKERMTNCAKINGQSLKVIAPVPYFPPIKGNRRYLLSQVQSFEISDGLEVYHPRFFILPKIGMSLYGLQMFLSVLPTVKRIQQEFDFDLIDGHFVYPDGFAAVLLGWWLNKPVVISARGSDVNLYKDLWPIRHLLRFTLRKANKVIAVSRALKDVIVSLGIGEDKIAVIPNGVDQQKFFPVPKENARHQLGLPARRIILSVGNLTPNKGFDLLIKAVRTLVQQGMVKDAYLVIVGEGPCRGELSRLVSALGVEDVVRLVGAVPHHELRFWYSAADLFCLASKREGWPNVLGEALACGTPVVATNVGGIPEIIASDKVGFLTARDEQYIAETIRKALSKSWRPEAIAQYIRPHTWDQVALSIRRVFEAALVGSRGARPDRAVVGG